MMGHRLDLRAGRVFLRSPTFADANEFLALVRKSRRLHRPWAHPPDTRDRFDAYLRGCSTPRQVGFLACDRATAAIAGVFTLSEIVRGPLKSAYLGFYAFETFAGRGYMTEGLSLVARAAFGEIGLHRIEANIQPTNRRSIALVKRCRFRREGFSPRYLKIGGRWRDHERWALLREDWKGRG